MRLAAARVPSDPAVARLQRQRRGGEQAAAEPAVLRADQIPKLPPHMHNRPLRMFPPHHLVEPPPIRFPIDPQRHKSGDPVDTIRNIDRRRNRLGEALRRPPDTGTGTYRRQHNTPRTLKLPQRRQASRLLQPATRIAEIETRANLAHQSRATGKRIRRRKRRQCLPSFVRKQGAANQILCKHAP